MTSAWVIDCVGRYSDLEILILASASFTSLIKKIVFGRVDLIVVFFAPNINKNQLISGISKR